MNPANILKLISDLVGQIYALQQKIEELETKLSDNEGNKTQ